MMKMFNIFNRQTVKLLFLLAFGLCLSPSAALEAQAQQLPASLEEFRNSDAYKKAMGKAEYQQNANRPESMDGTAETLAVYHENYAKRQQLKTEKDQAIYDNPANAEEIAKNYDEAIAKQEYLFEHSYVNSNCAESCAPKCYYSDLKECTFCGLFKVAFNTASKMAAMSINTFSGSFLKVVIIVFALWLAVLVLGFVSSIETRDFKDFAQNLIHQSFYVLIAVILLKTGAMSFFNLALEPIFNTGLNIAQATISAQDVASKTKDPLAKTACPASGNYGIITDKEGGALPPSMGENIICTMTLIQARAAKVKALGSASLCYSWEKKFLIIPHLAYMLTGLGLWVGAMILIIAVPFLMIDSVIELAIAAALLPFAIAAYAFKITRKYTSPVWNTFLNSVFAFLFICLIALMLTTAFEQVLLDNTKDLDQLLTSGTDANLEDMLKTFSWWSGGFLRVSFALILTWTVMGEVKDFAGQFSKSISNTSFGSQIGTMGGSFAKSAALKATKPLRNEIADSTTTFVKRTGSAIPHFARRAYKAYQVDKIKRRAGSNVREVDGGRLYGDDEGNEVFEAFDGETSIKTVKNVSGKKVMGIRVRSEKKIVKEKNDHFSVTTTEKHNRKGEVVKNEKIRLNSNAVKRVFNEDGTLNNETYEALMNSAQGSMREKVQIAVAKEIIHQKMPNLEFDIRDHNYENIEVVYNENGTFAGFNEISQDGTRRSIRLTKGENDRMMVTFAEVDKRGRGRILKSDGVLNKKTAYTVDKTALDAVPRSQMSAFGYKADEKSIKTAYNLDASQARYNRRGSRHNIDWKGSMFETQDIENAQQNLYARNYYDNGEAYEFRTARQTKV